MMKNKFYKKWLVGLTPELHEIVLRRVERRGFYACANLRKQKQEEREKGGMRK